MSTPRPPFHVKCAYGAFCGLLLLAGCAATGGRLIMLPHRDDPDAAPPPTTQPADANRATVAPDAAQSGWLNAAVQGLTGIQVQTTGTGRLMVLLGFVLYLSHRREVIRLKQTRAPGPAAVGSFRPP